MTPSVTSADPARIDSQTPLYNSRILGNYIDYLEAHHVELDIDDLLQCCGLNRFHLNDAGQLLTQEQINAFHRCLDNRLIDADLAYKVGQFAIHAKSTGILKKFGLQFITTETMYKAVDHIYPKWSRGHLSQTTITRKGQAEITIQTRSGVKEEPFQCRNRQGIFEAIARIQTGRPAKIHHPDCMHRGSDACRYQICWKEKRSTTWKRLGMSATFLAAGLSAATAFFLPLAAWGFLFLALVVLCLLIWMFTNRLENRELRRFLKEQGDIASQLLEEVDARHQNTRLIQAIGQAGTDIQAVDAFLQTVLDAMARNLNFPCGLIALCQEENHGLRHGASYGFSSEERQFLEQLRFTNDPDPTNGRFVHALKHGHPFFLSDTAVGNAHLPPAPRDVMTRLKRESLVCVPLRHKQAPLGFLFVDTQGSRRVHTASDMSLLMGVAAQITTGIINARAYAQIQASEHRYRLVAEHAKDVIWILDTETLALTYVNPSVEKAMGYAPNEIMALSLDRYLTPQAYHTVIKALSESMTHISSGEFDPHRDSVTLELEEIHKDGHIIPIEVTAGFLLDETGTPKALLGISRDLSLRKKDEQERHETESRRQQAKKMESLGTMAGSIAHNFNNLLMVVLGNLELAKEEIGDAPPAINIQRAIHASQRAADLSSMMLTYVGQLKKESAPVDLSQMVLLVLKNIDESTMTNITLDLELADPMPLIAADASQMRQIIAGFVTNAIEAIGRRPGRVRISTGAMHCDAQFLASAYLKEDRSEGMYAYVEVADTGCGMDAEILNKVFDPFFSTKFTGRGLGMAAVLGIIRSHNGIVRVESKKNEGAVFTALFPIQGISHDRRSIEAQQMEAHTADRTILLVDDEALVMDIGSQFLKRLGYTVRTASSGSEAIEILGTGDPIDCLLLDFSMPGMDGLETLQKVRECRPDVRIVITSGYARQQIEDRFVPAGLPDDFIQKPFEIKVLQGKLNRLFASHDEKTECDGSLSASTPP